MNVLISGGGDITITIANKLIAEGHNVTIIESNSRVTNDLQSNLDALIIEGNAIDSSTLIEAGVLTASLFLALTNDDNVNILSCSMVKKINKQQITTAAKIENPLFYFDNGYITHSEYGIDLVIEPKRLMSEKVISLIQHPETIEFIRLRNDLLLTGYRLDDDFPLVGTSLAELVSYDQLFTTIRIIAIHRNNKVIIPTGGECLLQGDRIYIIGKEDAVDKIASKYFISFSKIKSVIIVGDNEYCVHLARELIKLRYKVKLIVQDDQKAKELAPKLKDVHVFHGSATDPMLLNDVRLEKSYFVSASDDDEYNIIAAANAGKSEKNAIKSISVIKNHQLVSLISNLSFLDVIFTPHILTVGEVLKLCRKDSVISVFSFSEINAETLDILVSEDLDILNIPLKDSDFPKNLIIGVIIRDDVIIIPTGQDSIQLNDKLIIFLLPEAFAEVEKIFKLKGQKGKL